MSPRPGILTLRRAIAAAIGFAVVLAHDVAGYPGAAWQPAAAWADDGDDGGGGGGSAGSSGGSGGRDRGQAFGGRSGKFLSNPLRSFRRAFMGRPAVRRAARAPRAPVVPPAPREIVALGLSAAQISGLSALGFGLIESSDLAAFGGTVAKFRLPGGLDVDAARAQIVAANPEAVVDLNDRYRPEQDASVTCSGEHCRSVSLVNWTSETLLRCPAPVSIGMIDTAINPAHESLVAADLELIRLRPDAPDPSGAQHGTAVAALLVGSSASRTPGLVPGAKLIAVDAFRRVGRDSDRADAYDLVRAIDILAGRGTAVANMSLSGPDNDALRRIIAQAIERGMVIVAPVGNDGHTAKPVFPGAFEGVFAVTAVDQAKRVYRRAVRGSHVDFAAPGVNVWTAASIRGGRAKSGTSFAAPFVAAAAALAVAAGDGRSVAAVYDALRAAADDLGAEGRDDVFGWGLLNAERLCGA